MRVAIHVDQLWFSAPGGIGTYDVLLADRVVITTGAIDALEGGGAS